MTLRSIRLAIVIYLGMSHAPVGAQTDAAEVQLGPDLSIREIAPGFFLHVSKNAQDIQSNGLLARIRGGILLIDTPWTEAQTARLLDHATANIGPVIDAIVTHTHADRMGGLPVLRQRGVRTRAVDLSVRLAARGPSGAPEELFPARQRVYRDPRGFEVMYPGPGHTIDNTVVWFPTAHLLVGGCLVKAAQTSQLGNVADADLSAWPRSVKELQRRYPRIDILVPGHGPIGGPEALTRTLQLVQERATPNNILETVPAKPDPTAHYLFYVHGRILESEGRSAVSAQFGVYAYDRIVRALASRGDVVISELRRPAAGVRWAEHLVRQVQQLLAAGVPAQHIAVIGASQGGLLALQAATKLKQPAVCYVVLAGCGAQTEPLGPTLQGHILSIYDRGDRFTPSCRTTFAAAEATIASREIVTDLGLDHGLLYTPRAEWMDPAFDWIASCRSAAPPAPRPCR